MAAPDSPNDLNAGAQHRAALLRVGALLAAAGGALDVFTYVGHGHVFANAMTGNVVLLGVDAVSGSWHECLRHILPILMFLLGVATAKLLRLQTLARRVRRPESVVLWIEMLLLAGLGFLPPHFPDFPITMSIAFAASLQMATFREVHGRTYSSTFATGNLRTMVESIFDWLAMGRRPEQLAQARDFAVICTMFLAGAALSALATPAWMNRTVWLVVGVLAAVDWTVRGKTMSARRPARFL